MDLIENENSVPDDERWFYGNAPKRSKLSSPKQPSPSSRRDSLQDLSHGDIKVFPKQRLAIAYLEKVSKNLKDTRIFSFETSEGVAGERKYCVATLERFWGYYQKLEHKNMYELIYENFPCRLYFDLEYTKKANPDINHEEVYGKFLESCKQVLDEHFSITCDPDKDFLVLDSSSADKFSAHIICHLDKLFPSSSALRTVTERLWKQLELDPTCAIWNTDRTKNTFIFDRAVYTKNRNFRLVFSSKQGSDRVLRLADYCKFYGSRTPSDKQLFYDSLCVPSKYETMEIFDLPEKKTEDLPSNSRTRTSNAVESKESSGPSPYPQLDEFMLMIMKKWNPSAYFRQWKITCVDNVPESIIYYPSNCRYCFNIGREHKSNGTYWTVDLQKRTFYQKCFDFECKSASSNIFPLPTFVNINELTDDEAHNATINTSILDQSQAEVDSFFNDWDTIFDN